MVGSVWGPGKAADSRRVGEIHCATARAAGVSEGESRSPSLSSCATGGNASAPELFSVRLPHSQRDREGYGYAAFVYDPDGHNVEAVCFDELEEGKSLETVQKRRIREAGPARKTARKPTAQRAGQALGKSTGVARKSARGKRSAKRG